MVSPRWRSPAAQRNEPPASGLGRGRPDLRRPRRGRAGSRRCGARRRQGRSQGASLFTRRRRSAARRREREPRPTRDQRAAGTSTAPRSCSRPRPARRRPSRMPKAALRTGQGAAGLVADPARAPQAAPSPVDRHAPAGLFPAGRDGAGGRVRWWRCCRRATSSCASSSPEAHAAADHLRRRRSRCPATAAREG